MKFNLRKPLLATCCLLLKTRGFLRKTLTAAEHIVAVRDIHDPFIYMDTFLSFLGEKPFVLNKLK